MNRASSALAPLALALPLLGVGCQDYLFDQKFSASVEETDIVLPEIAPTPADIIFVVDDSNSMADEQELLAASFERFVEAIADGDGDYRMMVVTTNQGGGVYDTIAGGPYEWSGQTNFEYSNTTSDGAAPAPKHTTYFGRSACNPNKTLEHSCHRGTIVNSNQSAEDQKTAFTNAVRVGSCGSNDEKGLDALANALAKTPEASCNDNFLRSNANLIIVFVSDEDDSSSITPKQLLAEIQKYKDLSQIRIAVIVGADSEGEANRCRISDSGPTSECGASLATTCTGAGQPAWCADNTAGDGLNIPLGASYNYSRNFWCNYYPTNDEGESNALSSTDCCSALAGATYVTLAKQLENDLTARDESFQKTGCVATSSTSAGRSACLVESICQDNFGDSLARIATELVIDARMALRPAPVNPEGVNITITGGRYPEGRTLVYGTEFTIQVVDSELAYLNLKVTPTEGESLKVSYVTEVEDATPEDDN